MPPLSASFELVEFEQVDPVPSTVLLRLAATGANKLRRSPSFLVIESPYGRRRHDPLPAPPSDAELIRMAFSVPVSEMRGAAFALELPDGSTVDLPAPERRLTLARPVLGETTTTRAVRDRSDRGGRRRDSDALAEEALAARASQAAAEIMLLRAGSEGLRAEAEALRAETEGLRTAREAEVSAVRASLDDRESEALVMRARIEELEARQGELEASRGELEGTRSELEARQGELEASRNELEASRGELEGTRSELEGTRSELEASRNELDTARGELEQLRTLLSEASAAAEERGAEIAMLRQALEASVPAHVADTTGAEATEVGAEEAALESVAAELGQLQELLQMHERRVEDLDRYGHEMERWGDDLESHLDETLVRATEAEGAIAAQRVEIAFLRQLLADGG